LERVGPHPHSQPPRDCAPGSGRGRCTSHVARVGASPRGWTLIELTIVISLITVLAGIALVSYRTAITRSEEAVLKEDLFRMRDAIDQYYADKQTYPPDLDALVSEGYLRTIPEDPFTRSRDTWQTVMAEFDPANPSAQGIYDVKSGSEALSLEGTPYSQW
jgi:general secretion pathway protein G